MNKEPPLTNLDKLVDIVGSKTELANIIGRHKAVVSRMAHTGTIPWHFNVALERWARDAGRWDEVRGLLEPVCPCCGRGLTPGIDSERRVK